MTSGREPIDWADHNDIVQSLDTRFRDQAITEDEYRRGLARQGFNATDIEQKIKENKPHGV